MSEPVSKYTGKEVTMMASVMQCLKEGLPANQQIDIPKLATMVGMTEGSAKETWRKLKIKIGTEEGTSDPPSTAKKSGGGAKKRVSADGGGEETPSKKARVKRVPAKGKAGKAKAATVDDEEEDADVKKEIPESIFGPRKALTPESNLDGDGEDVGEEA